MEWVVVGLLLGIFFLVAVPWAAFAASGRSSRALAQIAQLQADISALRAQLSAIQAGTGVSPSSPLVAADDRTDAPESDAPEEAVTTPESPPVEAKPPEPVSVSEIPAPPSPPSIEPIQIAARSASDAAEAVSSEFAPPPQIEVVAQEAQQEPATAPRRDIEATIGSRWAVWVGGLTLAFGGLFLIRYSIEAGMFGPGARLLMGAAFAVLLAIASEYLRRREAPLPFPAMDDALAANIPAILAGVSVLAGFGVAFAAHAIYDFIGPTTAFMLMALIGLSALAASLVHGPALGLFGVVGSYITPFLISSTAPAFASLSLFIAFVTATAFLLHVRRPNAIVTLAAVAGHGIWTVLIALTAPGHGWPAFLLMAGAVLALALIKEVPARLGRAPIPNWAGMAIDVTSLVAIAVPLVISGILWVGYGSPGTLQLAIVTTILVGVVAAVRHRDLAPLAPLSAAAAVGMVLLWPTREGALGLTPATVFDLIRLSLAPDAAPGLTWTAIAFAQIAGALPFCVLLTRTQSGAGNHIVRSQLAFASALAPVFLLLATALRLNGLERSLGFAALSIVLAAALFAASELLLRVERANTRTRRNPLALIGSAAYAAAGAIALGIAVAFALRETWLVVGLSISAAGVAVLARRRPIPLLRSMSASLATAALARWLWDPILTDMGPWPIFNWLIPAYALPALCFTVGALALRGANDRPRIIHQALAAFFAAAFVVLEVHQFFVGANLTPSVVRLAGHYFTPRNSLFEEAACLIIAIGLLASGFQILGQRPSGNIFRMAALVSISAVIFLSVGALGGLLNPLFDGTAVTGWPILNRLLWYIVAGAILGVVGYKLSRDQRSVVSDALSACAAFLISLGAILMVRHAFAGPKLVPAGHAAIAFSETVMITLVLLGLTTAARAWHDLAGATVTKWAVTILGGLSIAWTALGLGFRCNPILDGSGVDGPIIFNRILWGYGATAIAFAGTSWWLRDVDKSLERASRIAAFFTALLGAFLLIRHGFHGRDLSSDVPITLAESGVYASLGFLAAIALMIAGSISLSDRDITIDPLSAAVASCALFAVLALVASPFATNQPLSGILLLDNALVGYLAPSALAFAAAAWAREYLSRPIVERVFGATAITGALTYVLVEVRRAFVGPELLGHGVGSTELYAYSAAILLYGVALLTAGFRLNSKDLRLASLGIVTIAVSKAFLVDMSGLEGLLRALSFIGLGSSLVAIGVAYQRLLRREAGNPRTADAASA
ncbi:MAG TPA: DUF2339 domain-containing protein [Bosea sp. (in: a-proteobacteria)]|jgi:uncharacterized membrane protein|uniref:DUF2339 domain-containing protein n=1 Tax=Bosea sp. (in: a-proteobacteria) TaxID=1871050 RepID=UPI002E145D87|nr:DUF2339 domain-containing protein [Bosea sp. (in: a-proteobacteria)]